MSYTLPELGYAYDALEPHFDAQTMEIHHSKHHQAYVNNANAVLETLPAEFSEMCAGQLISQLDKIPVEKRTALRNNAGGHANHSLFWTQLISLWCKSSRRCFISSYQRSIRKLRRIQSSIRTSSSNSFWVWLGLVSSF